MSNGRDKHQSLANIVRELLMEDWYPIGVRGIPHASDEYDRYADTAYLMLIDDGANATDVENYLVEIASNHMGLGRRPEILQRSHSVAAKLIELRPQFSGSETARSP